MVMIEILDSVHVSAVLETAEKNDQEDSLKLPVQHGESSSIRRQLERRTRRSEIVIQDVASND
jgi:hypothetical protein